MKSVPLNPAGSPAAESKAPADSPVQKGAALALVVGLSLAVALIPLWSGQIPPLLDYHNHLARQYILAGLTESTHFQQFYFATWHFIPYLAFDAIVQALAVVMPIAVAGKVFLSLLLLSLALAPAALNLALFRRVTPLALLGPLMVHNSTVSLGFVNYLFSIGFALCLLALWIRCRSAGPWLRFGLFTALPLLLFTSHLLGFVIYTLTVGAFEFGDWLSWARNRPKGAPLFDKARRLQAALIAWQAAMPISLYLVLGQRQPSGTFGRNTYGGIERKLDFLLGLFDYLIPPYSWSLDRFAAVAIPAVLLLLMLVRRVHLSGAMAWPLAALLLLFLVMPMEFIGGWGADHRLLVPLGLVLVGSIDVTTTLRRSASLAFGLLAALVVVRVGTVTVEWRKAGAEQQEYVRAFDVLSNGARVFYAFGHAAGQVIGTRPVYHLPLLAVTKKQVYLPYLSVGSAVTLQYQPGVEPLQRLSRGPVLTNRASPNWSAILPAYDYFFLVDEKYFADAVPATLTRVFQGDRVTVYKGPRVSSTPAPQN